MPALAVVQDDFAELDAVASEFEFNDQPLSEELTNPDWFKLSFLDLYDDVQEALANGKRGIIVYFGQKHCPYCKLLLEKNWGKSDIVAYTRRYFDVVAIDVQGQRPVTLIDGTVMTEKEFAEHENTNFTPSLVFYVEDGKEALRLRGYYPPYNFRAALEYVADNHFKEESFRDFLLRGEVARLQEKKQLHQEPFFSPPPYALARNRLPAERPLVVFFEQGDCYACDVLHAGPLQDPELLALLGQFDVVQLSMWADTPVLTPDGRRLTASQWAEDLGLFYTPTLVFFDERGREIIRVDSVVQFYRLRNVLNYVASGGYKETPNFQAWRQKHGR